ncbi:unnamed protein product, partial [Staurois parvus]
IFANSSVRKFFANRSICEPRYHCICKSLIDRGHLLKLWTVLRHPILKCEKLF